MKKFILLFISIFAISLITNAQITGGNTQTSNKETKVSKSNNGYFALGAGYGNSYGGLGVRLQFVTGGNTRIGLHGGVGYLPSSGGHLLAAAGIQFFLYQGLYLDAQFGLFGAIEYSYDFSFYDDDDYYDFSEYYNETLLGPSLLLGYDWFVSDNFGINVATGLSLDVNTTNELYWASDLGLIIKF